MNGISRRDMSKGVALIAGGVAAAGMPIRVARAAEAIQGEAPAFLTKPRSLTVEERLDKIDIEELICYERFCRDNFLWDEMKTCFTEDSYVNISWYQGSGEGFVDASAATGTYAPHRIYDTITWINGDRAASITMATIQMRRSVDGVLCELAADSKLIYRTKKVDGQWLIAGFESIYDKDMLIPVIPNGSLTIPSEELAQYRDSYACLAFTTAANGMPTSDDLPGRDMPELVDALYESVASWLEGAE